MGNVTNFSLSGMTLDYKVIIWNFMVLYPNKLQPDKAGQASPAFRQNSERGIEMDITGIAKSHQADIHKAGKASFKLSDSLREQIAGYAREDAAQGIYMGNKFLALRKSEVAKVAPDRAGFLADQ